MEFSEIIFVVQKVVVVSSFALCFFVVLALCDLYKKRHIFKFCRNYKSYPFYPVIGSASHTIGKSIFEVIEDVKDKYGLPSYIWNGHDCHYITADASEIKVILNNPNTFDKGALYENIQLAFKSTLLLAKYDDWKINRKLYSRSFSQPILNSFVDVFYEKCCLLTNILKDSHSRDIYDIFSRFSLDNFCANIMTIDLDVQRDMTNKLILLIDSIQETVGTKAFTSYFIPLYLYIILFSEGKDAWKKLNQCKHIIYKIIQDKKKVSKLNTDLDFMENRSKHLMDMILESGTFTDEEILREIMLFILAATDTSGGTLACTFTLLGMNPEAQEKVFQEVKDVVGLERPISYSDLPNLKYTERAIHESMRLLPVTPYVERYIAADVDLGNKTIPAGTNALLSIFNLHRNETYWKNPLQYNPDRFLPEEIAQRDPYAFAPFSAGPRNCIGMKYAMMLMKTAVAHVIRNYEVRSEYKSVEEMKFISFVTTKIVDLDCTFIPRNH